MGKLSGGLGREFTVKVTADLEKQVVTMEADGQTLVLSLDRKLDSITHVGVGSWNAVTDFSEPAGQAP